MCRSSVIKAIREKLAACEVPPRRAVIETFAIPLRAGAVHEWFGGDGDGWMSPLCVLVELARSAAGEDGGVAWIGLPCHPRVLIARRSRAFDLSLLQRSLFVDPPDAASRLWAIDTALRSASVAVVVADGRRLDMAASRRLQLAAESSGAFALIARPLSELKMLSAATTRWAVTPEPPSGTSARPCWNVELLRNKGSHAGRAGEISCWKVEWNHVACALVASPGLEHRPRAAATATPEIRLTG